MDGFSVQPGKRNVDRRHCQEPLWGAFESPLACESCQEVFKGDAVVFRSGLYHGVEELTSGTRCAIPGCTHAQRWLNSSYVLE